MYKSTYDKIDEILKERGLSRRKLAQMAGINVNTMSALFAKKPEKFPDKYLNAIAEALDVSALTLKASNIRLLARPTKAAEFDTSLITNAILRAHEEPSDVEPCAKSQQLQQSSFGQIITILESMDDEEIEIILHYIEYLKKKRQNTKK